MDDRKIFRLLRDLVGSCLVAQHALYEDGVHGEGFKDALVLVQRRAMALSGAKKKLSHELAPVKEKPKSQEKTSIKGYLSPIHVPDEKLLHSFRVPPGRRFPCKTCGTDTWYENEISTWCKTCEDSP